MMRNEREMNMSANLTRDEAIQKLQLLIGTDLRQLAINYGITVFKNEGGFNKGWVGHVVEHFLGLPPNSLQNPDFGDWELKTVSLKLRKDNSIGFKETMAITMINPQDVATKPFEESHLYNKIRRMVVCGRLFVDRQETSTKLIQVEAFDFDDNEDQELIRQIKNDYEDVRTILNTANSPQEGFLTLSGKMGIYIQPRTKGRGHGSISRAFYMRPNALKKLLKL